MTIRTINENVAQEAADYLRAHDPFLRPVIDHAGLCTIQPHTDYYRSLCDSIIGQQLSVKAAESIRTRFYGMFGDQLPSPEAILEKSIDDLRAVGFSRSKANYVHDLAQHIIDGKLVFDGIEAMSNDQIIAMLTDVKGIGEWTAHMFLMFCMGRLDVLPVGDLGIRNSMGDIYELGSSATPAQIREIALKYKWHPYESIASWYVWQYLDNKPSLD